MRKRAAQAETQPKEKIKLTNKDKIREIIKKPPKEKFLTESQKEYWNIMDENEIIFCTGAAGTGKSFLSMKKAIDLLFADNQFEKIIIVRPAVELDNRSIGALPGNLDEKMSPYILPFFYLLEKITGKEAAENLRQNGFIQVLPLNFMRGWNIDNAILLMEETQNSSIREIKLLLTRIGFNSKFIISGDVEQTDLYEDFTKSGLYDSIHRFQDLKKIGVFAFKPEDVVRNPLIKEILKRYNS